jgi:hypothetical protein
MSMRASTRCPAHSPGTGPVIRSQVVDHGGPELVTQDPVQPGLREKPIVVHEVLATMIFTYRVP